MIKKFRMMIAAMVFASSVGGASLAIVTPQTASAAKCVDQVLLFPTWYKGLYKKDSDPCEIKKPSSDVGEFIWKIALNVVEMALVAVGYIAVGYIIWGGFQYMLVATSPDRVAAARKTIINAVAGLVLSFFAVIIINIVVGNF